MPGLKGLGGLPLINAGGKVAPDEIDAYRVYDITLPATNTTAGTGAAGGTSATAAIIATVPRMDYPRSLQMNYIGTGTGGGGSVTITGLNQFGETITETIGLASGAGTAGTVAGTRVFAQLGTGTMTYGTHLGPGTVLIQFGTIGTTTRFGLPDKLGATTDVVLYRASTGILTGGSSIVNGTISTFVDAVNHAVQAPSNVTGTSFYQVWYKTTYDGVSEGTNANLTQFA